MTTASENEDEKLLTVKRVSEYQDEPKCEWSQIDDWTESVSTHFCHDAG
jgi:hypothetical protein